MTVFIDDAKHPYGRMVMSPMLADTTEELVQMATRVGVAAEHIQHAGTRLEHFDLCQRKRRLAIELGAVPVPHKVMALYTRSRSTDCKPYRAAVSKLLDAADVEGWRHYRQRHIQARGSYALEQHFTAWLREAGEYYLILLHPTGYVTATLCVAEGHAVGAQDTLRAMADAIAPGQPGVILDGTRPRAATLVIGGPTE